MGVFQNASAYRQAVKQAAVPPAAVETSARQAAPADPIRVQHYEGRPGDRTVMMKFVTAQAGGA
jgi:hypothetical protein